jgi:seryl-tRNA synthetase
MAEYALAQVAGGVNAPAPSAGPATEIDDAGTFCDQTVTFRDQLVSAGILVPTTAPGIYGHNATYEAIVSALDDRLEQLYLSEGATSWRFPPVISGDALERTGYISSFPHLSGSISSFSGSNKDHAKLIDLCSSGGDWPSMLGPAGLGLCAAVCQQLYGTLTGTMPAGGQCYEMSGWCFRHEPSDDPFRVQSFRQHEIVYVGEPERAANYRARWQEVGLSFLADLGLPVEVSIASDPFFGRAGDILGAQQRDGRLKCELVISAELVGHAMSLGSVNYHRDHFAQAFGIKTSEGLVAHSCCWGYGTDRLALALLKADGLELSAWPARVRRRLWP